MAGKSEVQMLMKGSLHTDELMGAVVSREGGMRTGRRLSHVFALDVPSYHKTLFVTDAAMNFQPDLEAKIDILQNAIDMMLTLEVVNPKVAILSAVESVNPAIPSTLDAAALCKMVDRRQITGAIVDGPLAFDNAISSDAARIKNIKSPVAGDPDLLMVPNLEAGNILFKELQYLAGAVAAGVVVGAKVQSCSRAVPTENWLERRVAPWASCSRSRRPTWGEPTVSYQTAPQMPGWSLNSSRKE